METSENQMQLCGKQILLVEDEYFLADDLTSALRERGADVIGPYASSDAARDAIAAGGFDCAVLDINLRGALAWDLAELLDASGRPLLITTGYGPQHRAATLKHATIIEKPYDVQEIVALTERLVRTKQPSKNTDS
jgi:DNA-binding response OmpR family regulator